MSEVKITERGWAGHLCCSDGCKFRRNTLLEYEDKKWIVSTVGAYVSPRNQIETIGLDRYYETMAFVGKPSVVDGYTYIDADVSNEIYFDNKWAIPYCGGDSDEKANQMHENVVKELTEKIKVA